MPLYDYKCHDCGDFEAWRKMAEVSDPINCPSCNVQAVRIFAAPSISLNIGSLPSPSKGTSEPRLVQRQSQGSSPRRHQSPNGGRPWMIGHASERL